MCSAPAVQTSAAGGIRRNDLRNIAIIAHVDHGKTTLVDCLLQQSGQYRASQLSERMLDSNDLEKERGITILAKNIAVEWKGTKINIMDTPGHADFGGEVERVLRMADGALVLVDAAEGPMPQTRFVLSKALESRLRPVVVVNKIDRPDARPLEVLDEILGLFLELGADDELADFPFVYASSRGGYASHDPAVREGTMQPLLDLVLEKIPGPLVDPTAPLRMLVTTLGWSDYVGRIAIGRVESGLLTKASQVVRSTAADTLVPAKLVGVQVFDKLGRVDVEEVTAGDIAAVSGIEDVEIGDTICDAADPRPLPRLTVDEPTLSMVFGINTSPLVGRAGKFLTTRHLRDRLEKELERNVALRVEPIAGTEQFAVAGRGLLHLSVLIETMRREGFEISVGKPRVILHKQDGVTMEPFETLVVEVTPTVVRLRKILLSETSGRRSRGKSNGRLSRRAVRPRSASAATACERLRGQLTEPEPILRRESAQVCEASLRRNFGHRGGGAGRHEHLPCVFQPHAPQVFQRCAAGCGGMPAPRCAWKRRPVWPARSSAPDRARGRRARPSGPRRRSDRLVTGAETRRCPPRGRARRAADPPAS